MSRDWIPILLTVLAIGALATSVLGGRSAELAFGALTTAIAPLLMLLGARRRGRVRAALWPILGLLLVLEGALAGLWVHRGEIADGPWWLGLPAATAILLYGLLLAPLVIVTLGFAWSFADYDVSDEELDALRRQAPAGDE